MGRIVLALTLVGASLLVTSFEGYSAPPAEPPPVVPSPRLKVDQSNLVTSPEGLGLGNGLYGQTFVPKAHNLAQVDLLLTVNVLRPEGAQTTIGLFADITQPPIATATAFVGGPAPGELARFISFRFDPPIPLAKKTVYTIGWYGLPDLSWQFSFGDPYPPGQVVLYDGTPLNPPADFVFTTFSLKP